MNIPTNDGVLHTVGNKVINEMAEKIQRVMQEMYDLGHADGRADMFFSTREMMEK